METIAVESNWATDPLAKDIESLFVQLSESIRELDVETRNCDAETKKIYLLKVVEHRKISNELQTKYRRRKENSERSDLIEGQSQADQDRYLKTNDKYPLALLFCSH
jgi:hypothetical protein